MKKTKVLFIVIFSILLLVACDNDKSEKISNKNDIYQHSNKIKTEDIVTGNSFIFGKYEQDNNTSNGEEKIEWIVLDKQPKKALLISKFALDCQPIEAKNWQNNSLRKWLNKTFLNSAFSSEEQSVMISEGVYGDFVSLLNESDVKSYFECIENPYFGASQFASEKCICQATLYAVSKGTRVDEITSAIYENLLAKLGYTNDVIGETACAWWLLPNNDQTQVMVDFGGCVNYISGVGYYHYVAVRPVIQISLE